jgi:hypothetical protein
MIRRDPVLISALTAMPGERLTILSPTCIWCGRQPFSLIGRVGRKVVREERFPRVCSSESERNLSSTFRLLVLDHFRGQIGTDAGPEGVAAPVRKSVPLQLLTLR